MKKTKPPAPVKVRDLTATEKSILSQQEARIALAQQNLQREVRSWRESMSLITDNDPTLTVDRKAGAIYHKEAAKDVREVEQ